MSEQLLPIIIGTVTILTLGLGATVLMKYTIKVGDF